MSPQQSNGRLANKIAVVTGGASGIGLAVAKTFLTEGAKVFIVDFSPSNISSATSTLKDHGYDTQSYSFHHADAADEQSVIAYVDKCVEKFGGLDVAVLNAGIGARPQPLSQLSVEEYDTIMRVNARGPFLGVKYCALKMKSLGVPGSIILTASIASQFCAPGLVAYTMSKHGVHALMSTAAQECTKDGIRVNAVSPGIVDTDMPKNLEDLEGMVLATPMRRIADPMEVAKIFLFLASEEASFVSGSNYRVDGAMLNH